MPNGVGVYIVSSTVSPSYGMTDVAGVVKGGLTMEY